MADGPRILVVGGGGVGGHIAARLHLSGADVSLLARGAHLQAIRTRGLVLLSGADRWEVPIIATDDPSKVSPPDLVIVSVKRHALKAALLQIQPLLTPACRVLFVMNGLPWWFDGVVQAHNRALVRSVLRPDPELGQMLSLEQVLWGVIVAGGQLLEPGVVRNTTPGINAIELGYADGHSDTMLTGTTDLLQRASFKASATSAIGPRIWAKLLLNAGQAMVATAIERTPLDTVSDPDARQLVIETMHEILHVGRALGIELAADPIAMTEPARSAPHRSSFLQDLQAGRPLELDNTILAVRDIGRALAVPVPHLSAVAAIVAARSADAVRAATHSSLDQRSSEP